MRFRYVIVVLVGLWSLPAAAQQEPILEGYYGEALREALVLQYKTETTYSFDRARDSLFAAVYLEVHEDSLSGTVRGVYTDFEVVVDLTVSDSPRQQAQAAGFNTEHTWPQSKGASSGNANRDLHHLHPTRADANSSRSDLPFGAVPNGEVSRWWYLDMNQSETPDFDVYPLENWSKRGTTLPQAHLAFEPREYHKGRAARSMFYFYTMYRAEADAADENFFPIQMDVLYEWHVAFPPDSLEYVRNNLIASYQEGKVNPFISDTSLVRRAFFSDDSPPSATFDAIYTFNGTTGCGPNEQVVDVAEQPANVTFSEFSRGGVQCEQGTDVFNSRGWPPGDALSEDHYVEFSVDAHDGFRLMFGEANILRFWSRRSPQGPASAAVRYRPDGGDWQTLGTWTPTDPGSVTTFVLPDLIGAETITFRVHGWNASHTGGTLRFDNVRLNGRDVEEIVATFDGSNGWRMLTVPGSWMTVAHLAAQNLVQGVPDFYPEANTNLYFLGDEGMWEVPAGGSHILAPGTGFIWFFWENPIEAPGTSQGVGLPFTLSFAGNPSDDDVLVPLHNGDAGTWTMAGNPFPFPIDMSDLADWSQGGSLESAVAQRWDPAAGSYVLVSGQDAVVEPWTGVMIENDDADAILFPTSSEAGNGRSQTVAETARIGFELTGQSTTGVERSDRAASVVLREDASAGWDLWDATKLYPLTSDFVLIAVEGERDDEAVLQAQASQPVPEDYVELTLAATAQNVEGALTLTWPQLDMPKGWAATLTDLETGDVVDLHAAEQYTFALDAARSSDITELDVSSVRPAVARAREMRRFTLRIERTMVGGDAGAAAAGFGLDAPYPNPARGMVNLSYTLPSEGEATLAIYDVLGRRVAILHDGALTAGRHRMTWSAASVAAGIYFLRLESDGRLATQRLVVAP